jgi:hypothetical protein
MSAAKKGNAAGTKASTGSGNNLPRVNPKGASSTATNTTSPRQTAAAGGGKTKENDGKLPKISPQKGSSSAVVSKTPTKAGALVPIDKKSTTSTTSATAADEPPDKLGNEKPSSGDLATPDVKPITLEDTTTSSEPIVENTSGATLTSTESVVDAPVVVELPAAEATPAPEPPKNMNGNVTLIYEQYNEQFPIVNGSTTHDNIDEVYCLSFVMPNCLIHLSTLNPAEKREKEAAGELDLFIEENPRGTYQGLEADKTYYVYVEQVLQYK